MIDKEKLTLLFKTIKMLNSSMDTHYILSTLLKETIDMTPAADAGLIFLWDEKREVLSTRHYINLESMVEQVALKKGESMTGKAFEARKILFFQNNEEVNETMNTMSQKNLHLAQKVGVAPETLGSSICCPLLFRDEAIGVMVIDSFIGSRQLQIEDVEFINLMSEQATTAIANSISFSREVEQRQLLQKQYDITQEVAQFHTHLSGMVLEGSTEKDLLKALYQHIGTECFILDLRGNISAYSIESEERKNLVLQDIPSFKQEEKKEGLLDGCHYRHYQFFPITVRRECMGWLVLLIGEELDQVQRSSAERVATVLALLYLKESELHHQEMTLRGGFVDQLRSGTDVEEILRFTKQFRFPGRGPYRIILMQPIEEEKRALTVLYELQEKLEEDIESEEAFITWYRQKLLIFCRSGEEDGVARRCIDLLRQEWSEPFLLGISESFGEIKGFSQGFEEAVFSLEEEMGDILMPFRRVFLLKFLKGIEGGKRKNFIQQVLHPLLGYRDPMRQELLTTLSLYLKNNQAWGKTRDELNIHGNTLTYRLRRIEEILGLHCQNHSERMMMELACVFLELEKREKKNL